MPIFEIERHEQEWREYTYMVEADTLAQAVDALAEYADGKVVQMEGSTYVTEGTADHEIHAIYNEAGDRLYLESEDDVDMLYEDAGEADPHEYPVCDFCGNPVNQHCNCEGAEAERLADEVREAFPT